MQTYRAAIVGCSRIGAFIDNEVAGRPDILLPYSHAAGYEACERTNLVAGADLRPDVLEAFGLRYGVPAERQFTSYREMIEQVQPDIVSVATQPEQHAEVALFAAEHGVRALYCEKPLCASLAEADAIVAAVQKHGVIFNMGTNRRWHPGYDAVRRVIDSGELGRLEALVVYAAGAMFGTATHFFDLVQRLNGDQPPAWVQGVLPKGDHAVVGNDVVEDPAGAGVIAFANGVTAHVLLTSRPYEQEVICEGGVITITNNGAEVGMRRASRTGRERMLQDAAFPTYTPKSPTLNLIEDLVRALDTGGPTRGGVRVAHENLEIIFGFIESHRRGGARVPLPLRDCALRLNRRDLAPRQPRYTLP